MRLTVAASHIRETMVWMMAPSTAQLQLGASHDSIEQDQFGAIPTEDDIIMGSQLSTGPSGCTFWSAVGVGALVQGSPVESVRIWGDSLYLPRTSRGTVVPRRSPYSLGTTSDICVQLPTDPISRHYRRH